LKQKQLIYLVIAVLFIIACGSSPTQTVTTVDVGSIQTAVVNTLVAGINQTSTADALTNPAELSYTPTLTLTATPEFTTTPEFTPTITDTPQATLPAGIASCVPKDTLRETALVLGIVDGDTINVQLNGKILAVRYIGVDAPETGKEYYGQAAQTNQNLVYSKTVTLISDSTDKDNNGVLLRYVIVDNIFVNYEIIKQGYAHAVSVSPDVSCSSVFASAESQAQSANAGIWIPTPAPIVQTGGGGTGGGGGFDSNGDGKVTCKDFHTQAAAQQAYNAGQTQLDGNDNDGKACETLP
jgi:micrococcal nuclease